MLVNSDFFGKFAPIDGYIRRLKKKPDKRPLTINTNTTKQKTNTTKHKKELWTAWTA